MSLKLLLTLSGGLEALVGAVALISPSLVMGLLLGRPADAVTTVLVRLFGAGVFTLGLACLKSRDDAGSRAGLAITYGMATYNVLAVVLIAWAAVGLNLGGPILWAAGLGHAVLGGLLVHALMVIGKQQVTRWEGGRTF